MTFDEEFPSLKKDFSKLDFPIGISSFVNVQNLLEKHCLDKQKVRDVWNKTSALLCLLKNEVCINKEEYDHNINKFIEVMENFEKKLNLGDIK